MSRIRACFDHARAEQRTVLIPYVTAGDPSPQATVPLMHALVAAGADILELGVPFSDPMADGPVIQQACERALRHGTGLRDVLAMVQVFREQNTTTPVVLMGYLNPVERMGTTHVVQAAAAAGVDGMLLVDSPPEEGSELNQMLLAANIDPIFLVAPTTTAQRLATIASAAQGFIYYVSLKGVTGSQTLDTAAVAERLQAIRAVTDLPLAVGFGIRDAETAAQVARVADAVVVGSALVRLVEQYPEQPQRFQEAAAALVAAMREAMDAVVPE